MLDQIKPGDAVHLSNGDPQSYHQVDAVSGSVVYLSDGSMVTVGDIDGRVSATELCSLCHVLRCISNVEDSSAKAVLRSDTSHWVLCHPHTPELLAELGWAYAGDGMFRRGDREVSIGEAVYLSLLDEIQRK